MNVYIKVTDKQSNWINNRYRQAFREFPLLIGSRDE